MTTETTLPIELLELAEQQPTDLTEFRAWCQQCYGQLEKHELADAHSFAPNDLHEHAALLVRQALVYVRRFVDPQKADNMPRVGAKCVSHALIRFQECIDWCDSVGLPEAEDRELSPKVMEAYRLSEVAKQALEQLGNGTTDRELYDYLQAELSGQDEYELPSYQTWARYVRKGRHFHGTNKNSPVAGRGCRSAIGEDQIEAKAD